MTQVHHKPPSCPAGQAPAPACDVEKQSATSLSDTSQEKQSAFKNLGILDRFLVVWIFLVMVIGIMLGNFVPSTGPALQKGKFVGVSIPVGKYSVILPASMC
jgi:arsenite transporter